MSQSALAEALDVTQGYISKIEAGMLSVADEKLVALAQVLRYPLHFFYQSGPLMGVSITEIFHRKRQEVPQRLLAKIHACVEVRIRNIAVLLRSVEMECKIPRFDIDEYESPADVARLVRAYCHIPRGPIQDLVQTLESYGVIVAPMNFETPKVDAISRWIPGLPPIFCVNMGVPKDRLRYSIAHELGHVVMHGGASPDMENEANKFAAEFLLPAQEIAADLIGIDLPRLAQLKRYWRVSMASLLHRAEDLQTITPSKARSLWAQMSKAGYRTREPVELDTQGDHPWLLHQLVAAHLNDLGYTTADMARILPLLEDELWAFYLQDQPEVATPERRRRMYAI